MQLLSSYMYVHVVEPCFLVCVSRYCNTGVLSLCSLQGDVSATVSTFHEISSLIKPLKKSLLSLQDVSDKIVFFGQLPWRFLC